MESGYVFDIGLPDPLIRFYLSGRLILMGGGYDMDAQTAMDLYSKELLSYNPHGSNHDMFYYKLPYVRNYELTNSIPIAPQSGNIIKFYQYQLSKPVIIFTDAVDTTAEEIDDVGEEYMESDDEDISVDEEFDAGVPADMDGNRELSEDEIAALFAAAEAGNDVTSSDEEVYDKAPNSGSTENWEAPEL